MLPERCTSIHGSCFTLSDSNLHFGTCLHSTCHQPCPAKGRPLHMPKHICSLMHFTCKALSGAWSVLKTSASEAHGHGSATPLVAPCGIGNGLPAYLPTLAAPFARPPNPWQRNFTCGALGSVKWPTCLLTPAASSARPPAPPKPQHPPHRPWPCPTAPSAPPGPSKECTWPSCQTSPPW